MVYVDNMQAGYGRMVAISMSYAAFVRWYFWPIGIWCFLGIRRMVVTVIQQKKARKRRRNEIT